MKKINKNQMKKNTDCPCGPELPKKNIDGLLL